jgi:hypothetical protein
MTISKEIREGVDELTPRIDTFLRFWKVAVAALVVEAVLVLVLVILCAVIAHRVG